MGDLATQQAALEHHFRELSAKRVVRHVFALEHGLNREQRDVLQSQIRSHCLRWPPAADHWLVWTVYAAEFGYAYAGREYWQTFETRTDGWQKHGSRHWIRDCFQRFAATFNGFTPSGPWSEHFSIICWPIVHAILPRDMQARIARMLYDVRRAFSSETLSDARALGSLIATRGWLGLSRLEQLADDEEVIGSIALALLFRDREYEGLPFLPSAIDRIAEDLAQHRQARDWLSDAQSRANAIALKGLRRPTKPAALAPPAPATAQEARRILDELGTQPSFFLAPSKDGWLVMLGLPNLSPLLARLPEIRDYLTQARPTVRGTFGEPLARQRVLQGDERIRLRRWPASDEVLLVFEDAPEVLRVILSAECLLRPGPTWLFRIGSDKVAYELRGRVVRPGQEYILLTNEQQLPPALGLTAEALSCDGISAYRLRAPSIFNDAYLEALTTLNVGAARALNVRPAGLAAAGWDGTGYGEWLAGERPCVAVNADHDVDRLSCRLPAAPELVVAGQLLKGGAPVFIEFPELGVGAHVAEFELLASDGSLDRGEMELLVRDRRPWAPGLTHDGALTVIVDPPAPSLEELWADRATVDVHGPRGRSVECHVRFWKGAERDTQLEKQLPSLKLPISRRQWSAHFRRSCRMIADHQNAYDVSDGVTINFVVPDVGRFELTAEREFAPLRWVARWKKQRYSLRLQDDRGVEKTPSVVHYAFEVPAAGKTLPFHDFATDGREVDGGLYVALADEQSKAIIVAPRGFPLVGSRNEPRVEPIKDKVDAIVDLLAVIELWSRARQVGSEFSLMLARPSFHALVRALFGALLGQQWAEHERDNLQELRRLIEHPDLARNLSDDCSQYAKMLPARRVALLEQTLISQLATSGVRKQSDDPRERLAEIALRFASDPGGVRAWAHTSKRLRGMISLLLHLKEATRAARYLVLVMAHHLAQDDPQEHGLLYPGWEWA
jgi:hypothetical protein